MPSRVPPVSVVMPVRNALPYLHDAVRSILAQTHGDFEFVIRDDASTDGSAQALHAWASRDPRIRFYAGSEALGPAGNSNWVVRESRGALVARMDADDVSHPDRLRRQLEVLRRHPDAVMVGTLSEGIDARSRRMRGRDLWRLAASSPFAPFPHGSVTFRRAVFDTIGGYREACDYWEDMDLFLRFARAGRVLVLPDALYRYRFSGASSRVVSGQASMDRALGVMYRCLEEHRRGRSYEPLLAAASPAARPSRPDPRIICAAGSVRLWSGQSTGTLRALLRSGALRGDGTSLRVLAWSLLGAAAPGVLRRGLRTLAWARNIRLRRRFVDGVGYDWRCGGGGEPA